MKALQQVAHGDPGEVVKLIDLPDPEPAADEVVIELEASALHLADIKLFRGDEGFKHDDLPKQPGYEGVGRVVEIGSAVTNFKIGDRVFPWWGAGTFAQKVCVKAETTLPAPDGDREQLALMMVNGMTSVCLLEDFAELKEGDWIVQNGANSSCGRYLIVLAKERGIKTCNIVRRENLFGELNALGADACVVDTGDADTLAAAVKEATGGADLMLGLDLVAGDGTTRIARCLNYGGKVVNYGFISGEPCSIPFHDLFFNNITLTGMSTGRGLAKRDMAEITRIYEMLAGKISAGELKAAIAGTYTLDQYAEAFAHAVQTGEDRKGKVILLPNG
ncbi:MAG: zinc-binding dehydrogenase [Alphaproteobacteria bacterium]|nr:zinc-binding dehydrogenase [Alphaproteobacteria bacterium]